MMTQLIGANRLLIQSDCMEVDTMMQEGGFSATWAAAIYDECHSVWLGFDDISIKHCNRTANSVAHELVTNAFFIKDTCI